MSSQNLVCPGCYNQYPLSKNFTKCPVCKINLTIPNGSRVTNKRKAGDIKHNSGPVILGDGNIINENDKSERAMYDFHQKGNVSALQLGSPFVVWLILWTFFMWLLNVSGSIASILSIFGVQIKSEQLKLDSIFSGFPDLRMIGSAILTVILIYFICNEIRKIIKLNDGEYVHIYGSTFYKKDQGIFKKGSLRCPCPDDTCSGTLEVRTAPANKQGNNKIIGRCNRDPSHTYRVDLVTGV
jgi:hypothetical protein